MKTVLILLSGCLLAATASAEFRVWTRGDGKIAELELLKVSDSAGGKRGEFRMRDGRTVVIAASVLSADDAKLLDEWQPAAAPAVEPAAVAAPASAYDKLLDGNLVRLDGRSLKSCRGFRKPTKYYLFYHTASWCGPCRKFTPSLVDFYNKHKPANTEFEVILITSDNDEKSMEEYAVEKQMPWPQLKLSRVEKFRKEFPHPGRGIPNLVLTDPDGKLLKTSYEGETYLGPTVVMNHLESLLTDP
jgi:nucleoredoxin